MIIKFMNYAVQWIDNTSLINLVFFLQLLHHANNNSINQTLIKQQIVDKLSFDDILKNKTKFLHLLMSREDMITCNESVWHVFIQNVLHHFSEKCEKNAEENSNFVWKELLFKPLLKISNSPRHKNIYVFFLEKLMTYFGKMNQLVVQVVFNEINLEFLHLLFINDRKTYNQFSNDVMLYYKTINYPCEYLNIWIESFIKSKYSNECHLFFCSILNIHMVDQLMNIFKTHINHNEIWKDCNLLIRILMNMANNIDWNSNQIIKIVDCLLFSIESTNINHMETMRSFNSMFEFIQCSINKTTTLTIKNEIIELISCKCLQLCGSDEFAIKITDLLSGIKIDKTNSPQIISWKTTIKHIISIIFLINIKTNMDLNEYLNEILVCYKKNLSNLKNKTTNDNHSLDENKPVQVLMEILVQISLIDDFSRYLIMNFLENIASFIDVQSLNYIFKVFKNPGDYIDLADDEDMPAVDEKENSESVNNPDDLEAIDIEDANDEQMALLEKLAEDIRNKQLMKNKEQQKKKQLASSSSSLFNICNDIIKLLVRLKCNDWSFIFQILSAQFNLLLYICKHISTSDFKSIYSISINKSFEIITFISGICKKIQNNQLNNEQTSLDYCKKSLFKLWNLKNKHLFELKIHETTFTEMIDFFAKQSSNQTQSTQPKSKKLKLNESVDCLSPESMKSSMIIDFIKCFDAKKYQIVQQIIKSLDLFENSKISTEIIDLITHETALMNKKNGILLKTLLDKASNDSIHKNLVVLIKKIICLKSSSINKTNLIFFISEILQFSILNKILLCGSNLDSNGLRICFGNFIEFLNGFKNDSNESKNLKSVIHSIIDRLTSFNNKLSKL